MRRKQFVCVLASLALTGALSGPGFAQGSSVPTYWLGARSGNELRFTVRVPADAAGIILHKSVAPGRGEDTLPRYRTFSHTIEGKKYVFHANELGWETPKLDEGNLTWAVEAGMGAEWRECDVKDPLWTPFAAGLRALSPGDAGGFSGAKVVMLESVGTTPPTIRLNRDGTAGKPTAAQLAAWKLGDLNGKPSLSAAELTQVRESLLAIANAGRANEKYRREAGSKTALELPKGLKPLALSELYNKAAQNQAEYCARTESVTHDQDDEKFATVELRLKAFGGENKGGFEAAGAGALPDWPTDWMKSETHYRPWWNLDGQVCTVVGFGVAKGSNGTWYVVALLGE